MCTPSMGETRAGPQYPGKEGAVRALRERSDRRHECRIRAWDRAFAQGQPHRFTKQQVEHDLARLAVWVNEKLFWRDGCDSYASISSLLRDRHSGAATRRVSKKCTMNAGETLQHGVHCEIEQHALALCHFYLCLLKEALQQHVSMTPSSIGLGLVPAPTADCLQKTLACILPCTIRPERK